MGNWLSGGNGIVADRIAAVSDAMDRVEKWTPGEPYRPLSFAQDAALRSYADPVNISIRHACEQREAQDEADGLACPVCCAPVGQRCFAPDARANHPQRAMAYYSARVRARNEGRIQ